MDEYMPGAVMRDPSQAQPSAAWASAEDVAAHMERTQWGSFGGVTKITPELQSIHRPHVSPSAGRCGEEGVGYNGLPIGHCVLEYDHKSPIHEDENGVEWKSGPRNHRRPSSVNGDWRSGFRWGLGFALGLTAGALMAGLFVLAIIAWGGMS